MNGILRNLRSKPIIKETRVNYQIKSNKVFLIDENNQPRGAMDFRYAIQRAEENELDLVEIAQKDGIPVCKVIDYGKWKYEQHKNHKSQPKNIVKELKMSPRIDKHDVEIKLKQVKKWISENYKVLVSVQFRGRETSYKKIGYDILENFKLPEFNVSETKDEGNMIYIWLTKNNG